MSTTLLKTLLCLIFILYGAYGAVTTITTSAQLTTEATKTCSGNGKTATTANTLAEWKEAYQFMATHIGIGADRLKKVRNFGNTGTPAGTTVLPPKGAGNSYQEAPGAQNSQQIKMYRVGGSGGTGSWYKNDGNHGTPGRDGDLDRNRFVIKIKDSDKSIQEVYMSTDHYENFVQVTSVALTTLQTAAHQEYKDELNWEYDNAQKAYGNELKQLHVARARMYRVVNRLIEYYENDDDYYMVGSRQRTKRNKAYRIRKKK
eukprot:332171_1